MNLPKPHAKQLEVFNDDHRFKVLNWGRRCFASGTQVFAEGGYKSIEHIGRGDKVLSYSRETNTPEWKTVLDTHTFGVDYDPKPMIRFWHGTTPIHCTYDHEFYTGEWVPAYKLLWRDMDASQREKLKLLCEQYGQTFDHKLEEQEQNSSNEADERRFWVFENSPRWTNNKSAQGGGRDLDREPKEQATGEPQKRRQDRQPNRESGVGDSQRKHSPHDEERPTGKKSRGEVRNPRAEGKTGFRDNGRTAQKPANEETHLSEEIIFTLRHSDRQYSGYFEGQELEISSIEVSEVCTTHDLTVEDNANYVVDGLLVHNSGKSTLAGLLTFVEAIKTQGRYFIIAPTYKQAKSIYWNDVIKTIIPPQVLKASKLNETELSITLPHIKGTVKLPNGEEVEIEHDTSLPRSTIELKGADNPDSLRGVKLTGVVLDEYAFMPHGNDVWDKIVRPALGDKRGWAVFISTPDGIHNHFYDLVQKAHEGKNYMYSHATALDNPFFPKEEFYEAKKDYEKEGRVDEFVQEWEADFTTPSKRVYRDFDRDIHVIDKDELPRDGTWAMGVDFGYTDPFAVVFVLIDFQNNWYVVDEIYQTGLTLDQALLIMRQKMGDQRFARIIGDAAGATEIATLKSKNLPIVAGVKGRDSIKAGIREIASKLHVREGTGKPKLFVLKNCKHLIKEFESYSYLQDAWGDISETPEDKNNHALDALRYLALDQTAHRKPRKRRQKMYDPITGRSLS